MCGEGGERQECHSSVILLEIRALRGGSPLQLNHVLFILLIFNNQLWLTRVEPGPYERKHCWDVGSPALYLKVKKDTAPLLSC